jgi:integrase
MGGCARLREGDLKKSIGSRQNWAFSFPIREVTEFIPAREPRSWISRQKRPRTQSPYGQSAPLTIDTTVESLFQQYRLAKAPRRSISEIERIFNRYILPAFGKRRIGTIERSEISLLLDQVAAGRGKPTPVMARAVAAQLSAFYSWAMPRVSGLMNDPCRFAAKPRKPRPRTRILSDDELRALWEVLDDEAFPWNLAIKFILLTGQRRGEVFNASRAEFDLAQALWTIPDQRSKNGRTHRVPLSSQAMSIIRAIHCRRDTDRLFPARANPKNGASGFSKAVARINRAVAVKTGSARRFTLQDLRRTVATGLQRIGVRLEVTEAVLNHVSGSRDGIVGVYQLYQFEDEKRIALDAWAAELSRISG